MIVDPSRISASEAYFLMISTIVPRPIAWVSTRSAAGVSNLAPFSYFSGVCAKPPMLSLCIGHRRWKGETVRKDTLRNIEETGQFVVHLSTETLAAKINDSSAEYPPEVSELEHLGFTPVPSERVRPARIRESPVAFECELDRVIMVGDPPGIGLVLGQIVLFHVDDAVWDESTSAADPQALQPVARLGGQEWARAFEVFSMTRPDWQARDPKS